MKALFVGKIAGVLIGLCGIAAGQQGGAGAAAPPAVVASAVEAVRDLGKQVVMGHYEVAVERMNPLWKERTAARVGGEAALKKQLIDVSREMQQQGITIDSSQPEGEPRSFEVGPGKKVETVNGRAVETLIYTKWLVLVSTSTKFRLIPQGSTKPVIIESTGYQAAISDKGKADWTFIDGSTLTLNDLRKMFINLPQDLKLPPVGKKESR